jgi:hypothetical protein
MQDLHLEPTRKKAAIDTELISLPGLRAYSLQQHFTSVHGHCRLLANGSKPASIADPHEGDFKNLMEFLTRNKGVS